MTKTRKCSRCHGTGKHGPITRAEGRCYQCSGTGAVAYSGERKKPQTNAEFYAAALQHALRYRDALSDPNLIDHWNREIVKLEAMLLGAQS